MDIAASPTLDFETFVKMLTTQLKNQDPLDPMDSANFASQLAAFSSVEQQVLTNNHLETIQTHLGSSELLQFTEWIGKFAKVTGPAHFSGTSIDIAISIPESTERADFIVKKMNLDQLSFANQYPTTPQNLVGGADYLWRNCTKCNL